MKRMTLNEINTVVDGVEVLERCLGGDAQNYISSLCFLMSEAQRKILYEALRERNAFYALPIEQRLIKAGFKKDKDGNLSKSIEL